MFWLIMQNLALLVFAALMGGLIGWALRGRRCQQVCDELIGERDAAIAEARTLRGSGGKTADGSRIRQLEKALAEERDEVAGLKAKLATTGVATLAAAPKEKVADEDEESLTFRNRYLESRVRFLEGKLNENETTPLTGGIASSADGETPSDMDVARLRWRNRYLEGRVRYLEEDKAGAVPVAKLKSAKPKSAKKATKPKAKSSSTKAKKTKVSALTGAAGLMAAIEADENYRAPGDDGKPATLTKPLGGKKDDLREIAGVGPKIEGILNDLGVFHFAQIASWKQKEIDWVDAHLTFKGRIHREDWIGQCKVLAEGGETEGQKKYKAGKHT